jgi:hypothetical protein
MKSGNLNFLEPSGPLQACNGNDLPFYILLSEVCCCCFYYYYYYYYYYTVRYSIFALRSFILVLRGVFLYVTYTTEFLLGGPNSRVVRMLASSFTDCPTWELNLCPLDLTLYKFLVQNSAVLIYCTATIGLCVITDNNAVLIYFAAEA